jgi:general secretion pathway protein G
MSHPRFHRAARTGFTLIELLLVLVILGVLAGVVVPRLLNHAEKSKVTGAKTSISTLSGVINTFALDCGRLPTTDEGLSALVTRPGDVKEWHGPYIEPNSLKDPWGDSFQYQLNGPHNPDSFDLYSLGPDGREGTADDIGNWTDNK